MLSWLTNAWRVPELRRRLLFTAMIIALYRLGSWVPAPGVDSEQIRNYFSTQGGTVLGLLNLFSGGALSQFSLFALGIMPYVTASIILQLLTVVVPSLERLQKEGEAGYAKINQYTRYLTIVLAAFQSLGYAYLFKRQNALEANSGRVVIIVITLTAGTALLMWMGELITKRGVGNGISIIIFCSIIADAPRRSARGWTAARPRSCSSRSCSSRSRSPSSSSRRASGKIPMQYARRVVGRRVTSGGSTYMPLRVNMAGVIPIIFAAAVLAFPPTIAQFFPQTQGFINDWFSPTDVGFLMFEAFLIILFTYFYTAVQFNPIDQADNLRKHGGYIPGIRPGPPTAQYLDRVLTRLTLPGSIYLALVAVVPTFLIQFFDFSSSTPELPRRHVAPDHGRCRARHDAPDGVADDDALLRRLLEVAALSLEHPDPRAAGVRQGHAGCAHRRGVRRSARGHGRDVPRRDRRADAARPRGRADPRVRGPRARRADDRPHPRAALGGRRRARVRAGRLSAERGPGRGARRAARGARPAARRRARPPGAGRGLPRAAHRPRRGGGPHGRQPRGDREAARDLPPRDGAADRLLPASRDRRRRPRRPLARRSVVTRSSMRSSAWRSGRRDHPQVARRDRADGRRRRDRRGDARAARREHPPGRDDGRARRRSPRSSSSLAAASRRSRATAATRPRRASPRTT